MVEKKVEIVLTEAEERLFQFLIEVLNYFQKNTTLRVAGGWVRDKILGIPSNDIDICLDNMTGKDFAKLISEYRKDEKVQFGVNEENSQKSKCLEIVTMFVEGFTLDLVNFAIVLSDNGEYIFETPLQDFHRRDITINSLYYNINELKVEDFSGLGLSDLQAKIIRTPVEAYKHIQEDPIRLLRIIRFATRLEFQIEDKIVEAANELLEKDPSLFQRAVTGARIGDELNKTFRGKNPHLAIRDLAALQQLRLIYQLDATISGEPVQDLVDKSVQIAMVVFPLINQMKEQGSIFGVEVKLDEDFQWRMCYTVLMEPFSQFETNRGKGQSQSISSLVLKSRLKRSDELKNFTGKVYEGLAKLPTLSYLRELTNDQQFDVLANFMINFNLQLIPIQLLYVGKQMTQAFKSQQILVEEMTEFNRMVQQLNLTGISTKKLLLDTKALMQIFNVKSGPIINQLKEEVIKYQARYPQATAESCIQFFTENRDSILEKFKQQ